MEQRECKSERTPKGRQMPYNAKAEILKGKRGRRLVVLWNREVRVFFHGAAFLFKQMAMGTEAKRVVVYGRVQGVGFRYFVYRVGTRLALTGNVCNCPDSTVEIFVEGEAGRIQDFVREVEKGPSLARVERLEIEDVKPRGDYRGFLIEGM